MGIIGNGLTVSGMPFTAGYIPVPATASIVTTGLQMYLDAGNPASYPGSGSVWTDTIAAKVFTLFNNPAYTASNGGYINFVPASSQYGYASSFASTLTNYTVEVWHLFTGTSTGAAPVLFGEGRAATTCNFMVGTTGGQVSPLRIQGGFWTGAWQQGTTAATDYYGNQGSGLPTAGKWYQFVNTYDGANIKFYVNTGLQITKTPANFAIGRSGLGLNIMRRQDVVNYWGGGVSIVRVYNTALTQAQVTQNYNIDKGRYGL